MRADRCGLPAALLQPGAAGEGVRGDANQGGCWAAGRRGLLHQQQQAGWTLGVHPCHRRIRCRVWLLMGSESCWVLLSLASPAWCTCCAASRFALGNHFNQGAGRGLRDAHAGGPFEVCPISGAFVGSRQQEVANRFRQVGMCCLRACCTLHSICPAS